MSVIQDETMTGVVVGVDGSPGSNRAVEYGAAEAARLGTGLHLVHVDPVYAPIASMRPLIPEDLTAGSRAMLETAAAVAAAAAPEVPVHTDLRRGSASQMLSAASEHAQLVVVGRETVPALLRFYLEAVTLGVAARATHPVVSVPPGWAPASGRPRIVVGFKDAAHSTELLLRAFDEAAAREAELTVVHSWQLPGVYDDIIVERAQGDDWEAEARAGIEAILATRRVDHPEVPVEVRVTHDQAAHALREAAVGADLLMVVRRVHGFPSALHLGSTARDLLHRATCPVEVVPPALLVGADGA